VIGLIGAGNMARALARGWGEPVLATDSGSGRAAELVAEVGGEALDSNAELVRRAGTVLLSHKPYQLEEVARGVDTAGKLVVSLLGGVSTDELRAAHPGATVVRAVPNTPVEVRRGMTLIADSADAGAAEELFRRVGRVVRLPERLMDVGLATSSVTPAYVALIAEAAIDAAVRQGLPASAAADLFLATLAGTAELIAVRGGDTLAVRREVTSPAGSTARGLAALERGGVRAALDAAMEAVMRG
jgi:pyrroline-5-carboxylate reductase